MFLAHRGKNFLEDLKFSGYQVESAFDVGAHYGESLIEIHQSFENAMITCFEPFHDFATRITEGCADIIEKMGNKFRLETLACSSTDGTSYFVQQGSGSHIVTGFDREKIELHSQDQPGSYVRTIRLDNYIKDKDYRFIDLLKVDVEGHEMRVLEGIGEDLLSRGFFRLMYLEAGVSTDNDHHTPFVDIIFYLQRNGYEVFGFYEQVNEFLTSRTHLRRTNIGFVHKSAISVQPCNFSP